jgi:hypothetical protein
MGVSDCDDRHFNAEELAAVSLGTSLGLIVLVTVMGIMMAVNAVVSHVGAEQYERCRISSDNRWMGLGARPDRLSAAERVHSVFRICNCSRKCRKKRAALCISHQHRHAHAGMYRARMKHHQPESDSL